jgi:hypothetical protein
MIAGSGHVIATGNVFRLAAELRMKRSMTRSSDTVDLAALWVAGRVTHGS